jgi:large conductance mechanosensitive channel
MAATKEGPAMFSGFHQFIARGNVLDLAVGVIIGAAFGAVVDSLVKDVFTPAIGAIVGQPDFSAWKVGAINIGNFINAIIAFLLKAAAVYYFIVVPFNTFAARYLPAPPAPGPTPTEQLLADIRDELKKK